MSRVEVFPIMCARRRHRVAVVVDDVDGRWLEIEHQPGSHRAGHAGVGGQAVRVPLSPTRADRIGCRSCKRSVFLSHRQIIDAIRRGDDGLTI